VNVNKTQVHGRQTLYNVVAELAPGGRIELRTPEGDVVKVWSSSPGQRTTRLSGYFMHERGDLEAHDVSAEADPSPLP
jgi:hypothetical protein